MCDYYSKLDMPILIKKKLNMEHVLYPSSVPFDEVKDFFLDS